MVERRFNKPLARIRGNAMCWLTESGSPCMLCNKRRTSWNEPMTLGLEVFQKATSREFNQTAFEEEMNRPLSEQLPMRNFIQNKPTGLVCSRFICLDCAEKTFDNILTRVRLLKAHGKDGYKLFDDLAG